MRRPVARGALVVVGGHSRGVGKTALIEYLLRVAREPWVAIKISAHRHAAQGVSVPLVEEAREPSSLTQTGRYLAAGAARAFLVRAPDAALPGAAAFIASLRAGGTNVIVESNRIVDFVMPDRVWFVVAPHIADWKASSARVVRCASVLECKWEVSMRVTILTACVLAGSVSLALAQGKPKIEQAPMQQIGASDGAGMFLAYCSPCHGKLGRGDGPAAPALKTPPADLTRIAARAKGTFPEVRVKRFIEGADEVAAHGTREMPMWGPAFRALNRDTAALRVQALADYLRNLQQK